MLVCETLRSRGTLGDSPVDIRHLIDHGPMTGLQLRAVSLCFFLNALDGIDILAISFAAPLLSREWAIDPTTLGVVFSAALAGMMAGSMLLAPLGDAIGRRKLLTIALSLIAIGMLGVMFADSVRDLLILRFVTGCGLGGVVPTMAAFAAELSPQRRRSFAVTLVQGGYPLGAVITGLLAAWMMPRWGWQSMFVLGGTLTLLTLPFVYWLLPESPEFLLSKRPPGALQRLNRMLRGMGHPEIAALPVASAGGNEPRGFAQIVGALRKLFSAQHRVDTLLLWVAFFMSLLTLYFLQNWVPQLVANAGQTDSQAFSAGTVLNLGLFAGMASVGYFADHYGLKRVIATYLGATAIVLLSFSYLQGTTQIAIGLGVAGFMQGGFIGLYAVGARIYPAAIRITGIGWAIGVARLGAVLGPWVAGMLVAGGMGMAGSFLVFAIPLAIAAIAVTSMRSPELSARAPVSLTPSPKPQ
jgi:AAHS family 4-hydroxybenzoate transporter-like MFS transporter